MRQNEMDQALRMKVVGQVRDDGTGAQMQVLDEMGVVLWVRPASQQEVMMYSIIIDMWQQLDKMEMEQNNG